MKWLAFTLAVVASLVGLGVWSVVPPSNVWEARTPYCSRCRAEVHSYSRQCAACDRSLRWTTTEEECRWCLSREDVEFMRDSYRDLELGNSPHVGLLKKFPEGYFLLMEAGKCANCAGIGKVREGDADVTCSVCRGSKACVACDGDREVVVGDEWAHRTELDRAVAHRRAERRSKLTGLPVRRSRLLDEDVEALTGYVEAEQLKDSRGAPLLRRGIARAALAFEALKEAKGERVVTDDAG